MLIALVVLELEGGGQIDPPRELKAQDIARVE